MVHSKDDGEYDNKDKSWGRKWWIYLFDPPPNIKFPDAGGKLKTEGKMKSVNIHESQKELLYTVAVSEYSSLHWRGSKRYHD